MKLRVLFTAATLGATSLTMSPTHAQTLLPCEVYMCMAGISGVGATGGPACAPSLALWHAAAPAGLAVWTIWGFAPPASYKLRRSYLTKGCPEANVATNAAILEAIMTMWGSEP